MLIRHESHPNDYPQRDGERVLLAQRMSNVYRLKCIRYSATRTYIKLYSLSEAQYLTLITYYGRQISHTRNFSEYLIVPDRKTIRVWAAKHQRQTNLIAVYPNLSEVALDQSLAQLKKYALTPLQWINITNERGSHYAVTSFLINKKDLEKT